MAADCSGAAGTNGPAIVIVPSFSASEPTHSNVLVGGPPTRSTSVQTWPSVPAVEPSALRTSSRKTATSPTVGPGLPVSTNVGCASGWASVSLIVWPWWPWPASADAVPASASAATARAAARVRLDTRVHLPDRDRPAGAGGDGGDVGERLEERAAVLAEAAARLRLGVPEDDHHRVAAGAVDDVHGAGEAGLGLERRDHLVGDDPIHGVAALGRRAALDHLCVHGGTPYGGRGYGEGVSGGGPAGGSVRP